MLSTCHQIVNILQENFLGCNVKPTNYCTSEQKSACITKRIAGGLTLISFSTFAR